MQFGTVQKLISIFNQSFQFSPDAETARWILGKSGGFLPEKPDAGHGGRSGRPV